MESPSKLTLEQKFHLRILKERIEKLPPEQARDLLLEAFRQMMVKDNWVRKMFKECYL